MKTLTLSLVFVCTAILLALGETAHAADPIDVQLNDPAYAQTVKNYLDGKRAQYRMVKAVGPQNFVKITVTAKPQMFGLSCEADVQTSLNGSEAQATASKSNSFVSKDKRQAFCAGVLEQALEESLGWSL